MIGSSAEGPTLEGPLTLAVMSVMSAVSRWGILGRTRASSAKAAGYEEFANGVGEFPRPGLDRVYAVV